uniref:Sorting nexin family member 30 n=1 Tax=Salmo trutta TaxID=8032 RepID=A0A673Z857_SALTR
MTTRSDRNSGNSVRNTAYGPGDFMTRSSKDENVIVFFFCKLKFAIVNVSNTSAFLDDDLDVETRDLFVTVDDPKKHVSTMETYITYRVVTKTTRVEFDLPEYSVRRRYQDFDWLRTSWRIVNGESVKYVTGGYKLRSRPMEFAAMGDYLDMFTQKLGTIDRIAQRIIKEQSGGLSLCAGTLCQTVSLIDITSGVFLLCQAVLKKRDNVHAEYEAKLEAASLRKEERPTAKVPTDVEKCQDRVECFNADLKSDWDQWQNNKTQDFRQLLTGMADHNIQYYEKVRGFINFPKTSFENDTVAASC